MRYFSFDLFSGDYNFFESEEEAKHDAEKALKYYKDSAIDEGWPEEDFEDYIGYGKVLATNCMTSNYKRKDYSQEEWEEDLGFSDRWDEVVDYDLKPIGE